MPPKTEPSRSDRGASAPPWVYLILGAAGAGRREVVADLIEGGLGEQDRPAVLLFQNEPADPADARLGAIGRWSWGGRGAIEASLPAGTTHGFLVVDGRGNPVDQIEAFASWLAASGARLARILCVVHCRLVEQHPPLGAWYEACIHFSDVVLLNRREGVENKWHSDFLRRYQQQCYPCLFEKVKAGRVANPALMLDPEARRVSHVFDPGLEWSEEEDEAEEDGALEGEEEVELTPNVDPYFARHNGSSRVKPIPNLAKYLK